MKTNIYVLLAMSSLFTSCKEKEKIKEIEVITPKEVVDEVREISIPNSSDIAFDDALLAFEKKDNVAAAKHIEEAIIAIKKETNSLPKTDLKHRDIAIAELNKLAVELKEGEIKNEKVMRDKFDKAEMNVGHLYMLLSNVYLIDDVDNASNYLKMATQKLAKAAAKMKGAAANDAIQIETAAVKIEARIAAKEKVTATQVKVELDKISAWYKKYQK